MFNKLLKTLYATLQPPVQVVELLPNGRFDKFVTFPSDFGQCYLFTLKYLLLIEVVEQEEYRL